MHTCVILLSKIRSAAKYLALIALNMYTCVFEGKSCLTVIIVVFQIFPEVTRKNGTHPLLYTHEVTPSHVI